MSVTLVDLDGITTARLSITRETTTLTLCSPSGFVGEKYYPAESVTISDGAVVELFKMLNEGLISKAPPSLPPLPLGAARQLGGFKL